MKKNSNKKVKLEKKKKNTEMLINALETSATYDAFLKENENQLGLDKFKYVVRKYLAQNQLEIAEVIKDAQLDRAYGYQIFNGTRNPSRDKLLQLAFGLKLNFEECNYLLKCANKQQLYAKVKRDATIIYALTHNYTLNGANDLLLRHDLLPISK